MVQIQQNAFAAGLNQSMVGNMFTLFKRKKFDSTLYDIELKMEHQQKQIDDLRKMILELSSQINSLMIEVNYLSNSKYGKSI